MSDGIYWHNKALALERRLDEVLMRSQAREDENASLRSELSGAREWATGQAEKIAELKALAVTLVDALMHQKFRNHAHNEACAACDRGNAALSAARGLLPKEEGK